jgi:uncharacterized protein with HEPN domain
MNDLLESRDEEIVGDMHRAAQTIVEFTVGVSFEQFMSDRKLQFALERLIDIIGQDAVNVSEAFRSHYADISWQTLMTLRHVLAMEDGAKQERMWDLVSVQVPELAAELESLTPY